MGIPPFSDAPRIIPTTCRGGPVGELLRQGLQGMMINDSDESWLSIFFTKSVSALKGSYGKSHPKARTKLRMPRAHFSWQAQYCAV
jgi:hypothetical protein